MDQVAKPFAGTTEHLLAEMTWLELLVQRQVLLSRGAEDRTQPDPFKGFYISDSEIEQLVGGTDSGADDSNTRLLLEQAAAARRELDAKKQVSLDAGVFLPLAHLSGVFALSRFEENVVLL